MFLIQLLLIRGCGNPLRNGLSKSSAHDTCLYPSPMRASSSTVLTVSLIFVVRVSTYKASANAQSRSSAASTAARHPGSRIAGNTAQLPAHIRGSVDLVYRSSGSCVHLWRCEEATDRRAAELRGTDGTAAPCWRASLRGTQS